MREILPIVLLTLTIIVFILNFFALMQLLPLYITLPALFVCIYLTLYSYTHKRVYRGMR